MTMPNHLFSNPKSQGRDGKGRFATEDGDEKGILPRVLQPGLYYVNTKEYEVIPTEVGIVQTTFTKGSKGEPNTAITVHSTNNGINFFYDADIVRLLHAARMTYVPVCDVAPDTLALPTPEGQTAGLSVQDALARCGRM